MRPTSALKRVKGTMSLCAITSFKYLQRTSMQRCEGGGKGEAALLGGVNLHASDGGGNLEGVLEVHAEVGAARFGCCKRMVRADGM